jgi:hypothetical protein
MVARIKQTSVPAGSSEANPRLSAPETVKAVLKYFKLSEDAASYYLQLLTLCEPTDKNITTWNGWTATKLKQTANELVNKKLVLEASRSRAGRKVFLPGGWTVRKAPELPFESWKIPLYTIKSDCFQEGIIPLGRLLPLEPLHTVFAKAWQRVITGDEPKYDSVK